MNTNETFDAMNNAVGGMMRAHDAREVAAGREPANAQFHEAVASLLCCCFFRSMAHRDLDALLCMAEEFIGKARNAAAAQHMKELEEVAVGTFAGTRFSR
jgi:hypothetical protein